MRADMVWEGLYEIGKNAFHTRREIFVTPDGVLVIRVSDSPEATLPFQMRVDVNQDIRVYLNSGIYNQAHAKWSRSCVQKDNGTVILAQRPKTCTATLAVAVDGPDSNRRFRKGRLWLELVREDAHFLHRSGFVLRKPRCRQRRLGESGTCTQSRL